MHRLLTSTSRIGIRHTRCPRLMMTVPTTGVVTTTTAVNKSSNNIINFNVNDTCVVAAHLHTTGKYLPANYTDIFPAYRNDSFMTNFTIEYNKPAYLLASNNMVLEPRKVKHRPKFLVHSQNKHNKYFSMCMVDPDAPSRTQPTNAQWMHWCVINIPNVNGEGDAAKGDEVMAYVPAAPPKDTGLHRYIFVVFAHDHRLQVDESSSSSGTVNQSSTGHDGKHCSLVRIKSNQAKGRARFNVQQFSEKYRLGVPIAMDSFQCEWDESVPSVHESFVDTK